MKLARKIVFALGVLAIVVLAVMLSAGVMRELRENAADMEHDHWLLGETLGAALARTWDTQSPAEAMDLVQVANRNQDEVTVRLVWLDDHAPGPSVPLTAPQQTQLHDAHWFSLELPSPGAGRRISWYGLDLSGRPAALEISQSLKMQQEVVTHTGVLALIAFGVLATLLALMSAFLGDRLVGRPVEKLVNVARRLGEGDLEARVELRSGDELETLGNAMSTMADDLQRARRRAEAEMTARLETLEHLRHADRLATVGKLAAGVAHELGTPLNVVSARAKMIATGEAQGDDAKDSARIIGQQVTSMTAIIRQLLDFARRRKVQRTREDIATLVGQVVRLLTPLAAKKGVRLDAASVSASECELDVGQINQVLTNLVMNAIHAMDHAGTVRISTQVGDEQPPGNGGTQGRFLRIDVQDEGVGIAPDVLPHIFEPFFTTKDVGEGTGLGLSVSWGIVQDHGGWIQVRSQPGQGATFSVYLPAGENECRVESSL